MESRGAAVVALLLIPLLLAVVAGGEGVLLAVGHLLLLAAYGVSTEGRAAAGWAGRFVPFERARLLLPVALAGLAALAASAWMTPKVVIMVLRPETVAAFVLVLYTLLSPPAGRGAPSLLALLLLTYWGCALWVGVIHDAGYDKLVVAHSVLRPSWLETEIFPVWERYSLSEHLFLGHGAIDSFEQGRAYSGVSPLFLLAAYLVTMTAQWAGGVEMAVAVRFIPVAFAFLIAFSLLFAWRSFGERLVEPRGWGGVVYLLALGCLLSLPTLWVTATLHHTGDWVPLAAISSLMVLPAYLRRRFDSRAVMVAGLVLALTAPYAMWIYLMVLTPMLLQPGAVEYPREQAMRAVRLLIYGFLVALAVYLYGKLAIRWAGLTDVASPLSLRSGLDGATARFQEHFQAIFSPTSMPRQWGLAAFMLFPALFIVWSWRRGCSSAFRSLDVVVLMFCQYLFWWIFFPQSVSIHPYAYDVLWMLPMVLLGVLTLAEREFHATLRGAGKVVAVAAVALFLMHNLINVAQLGQRDWQTCQARHGDVCR